jgi:NADPH-dependent glutamate synthase beta subunit-like oxidoreductase
MYDAVLLAVGAQQSQRLGIPGEASEGVIPATTFLKQFNLEPETHLEGDVAVIGGGSTAMDAARSALRAGASSVHMLYRRTRAEMPAQHEEVRAALQEGIQLHELVTPVEIVNTNGQVQTLRCLRMKLEEPDAKGRRRPVPIPGSAIEIAASIILVAIGEAPDPSFLPGGTSVQVAPWGGLLINQETLATAAPGVFAAGDVTYGPKSIIHAAAHGRKAAQCIHAYLRNLSPKDVMEMPDDQFETASTLPPDGRITLDVRPSAREEMPLQTGREAGRDRSVEYALGFTQEQARREASRCLRCDLAYLCPAVNTITLDSVVRAGHS